MATDDINFIERFNAGDDSAFNDIYHSYKPYIMAICLKMTSNNTASEDITQEIFIKLLLNVKKIDGKSLKSWIGKTTFNHVLNHFKRESKQKQVLSGSYELGNINRKRENNPFKNIMYKDLYRKLIEAVVSIKNDTIRKCAKAKFVFGFSNKDIAIIIGKSNQRVSEYVHTARQILKTELTDLLL